MLCGYQSHNHQRPKDIRSHGHQGSRPQQSSSWCDKSATTTTQKKQHHRKALSTRFRNNAGVVAPARSTTFPIKIQEDLDRPKF